MGRDATHLIVTGRHDRQRLFQAIDTSELQADFMDTRQALHDGGRVEMGDVQQDIVLIDTATATFLDFSSHGAGNHITRSQVLCVRRVTLHEALLATITQNAAFATHAFCDQHASAGNTGWVKLPEFHVFERDAGTRGHTQTVAGVDKGVGRRVENTAGTASREDGCPSMENDDLTRFHFHGGNTKDMPSSSRIRSSAIHSTKN
jgi:hypothetical protein